MAGYLVHTFGPATGFLATATAGGAATALLWVFLSETKPERYAD